MQDEDEGQQRCIRQDLADVVASIVAHAAEVRVSGGCHDGLLAAVIGCGAGVGVSGTGTRSRASPQHQHHAHAVQKECGTHTQGYYR